MKKFFKEKGLIIILWILLILLFVFGNMYSRHVSISQESIESLQTVEVYSLDSQEGGI